MFPDEFHLQTLEKLLEACPLLRPTVAVGGILAALMDRLTKHATDTPEMVAVFVEVDAFGKFMVGCRRTVPHCLIILYHCTRTHSPHPPPWPGHRGVLITGLATRSLAACSWCTVYPNTLAASSSLAWPVVPYPCVVCDDLTTFD